MSKKKIHVSSIILYVLAGLLTLYAAWAALESHGYISSMMEQNQISVSGSEYDIVNFYMANSAQYVLFAVILGTLGWMLQQNATGQPSQVTFARQQAGSIPSNNRSVESDGEDFEEWFRNNQN
ncbi:hypothetical protein [Paenibacillus sp. MDMC362]|uniref:hypothetical protein n=1 Tax=Paenibacillus sp. MDMC362 TaxID=2977365 RepID=UPI000DC3F762|nr:hypothetical protein [Paenibacillus sp. MDMC362]RAR44618.1 hypothetical protein DP091_07535 [Paenibacillus sp. MDMC362]